MRKPCQLATVLAFFCFTISAQAQTPKKPLTKPALANPCQRWFENEWAHLSAHGELGLQKPVPPGCKANPWVQWLSRHVKSATPVIKPVQMALDNHLQDIDRMNQLIQWAEQGRLKESINGFQLLLQRRPDWPELYYNLGIVHDMSGDLSQARMALQHAIDMCSLSGCRINVETTQRFLEKTAPAKGASQ